MAALCKAPLGVETTASSKMVAPSEFTKLNFKSAGSMLEGVTTTLISAPLVPSIFKAERIASFAYLVSDVLINSFPLEKTTFPQ